MKDSEINDLCVLMNRTSVTNTTLKTLKNMYYEISNGIVDENLDYFFQKNDPIIQEMMECVDLSDIEFLYDMMDQYLNMCGNKRRKLGLLHSIYETILGIIGEL